MVSEGPPRGIRGGGRATPRVLERGPGGPARRPSEAQGQGPLALHSGSGPPPHSPAEETEARTS